jgi:adenosylcobinamide kinase/adenosylcobinamide-phosphate guanylyltransferase
MLLVLGGARSGKSRYAEVRVRELGKGRCAYFATAEPFDDEMRERIARHRERRGGDFFTVEAPHDLEPAIARELAGAPAGLVDCITVWLSNRMLAGAGDAALLDETDRLIATARAQPRPLVLVANEVGFGIVPDNALARRFRDVAGLVNQKLAAAVDEVQLVVAGLPLRLR